MSEFERELQQDFLTEAEELLGSTERCFLDLENASKDPSIIEKIFRLAHNLKGSARAVGFTSLADFTHVLESLLLKIKNGQVGITPDVVSLLLACNDHLAQAIERLRANPGAGLDHAELIARIEAVGSLRPEAMAPPFEPVIGGHASPSSRAGTDESIRVSLGRISRLMNNVGELVILQTVLDQQKQSLHAPLAQNTITQMAKIIREVQEISMSLRLVPLKQAFQKMQRIVRDTSAALGKSVRMEISGEDTEVDKTILENLGDPLVHLIRNAVDHGIEEGAVRKQRGKPVEGTVRLRAFQKSGSLVIEVSDDGGGLDAAQLREKAIEKKLIAPDARLSERESHHLIFKPGFSTRSVVTDVSGRGVGMDVVKTNIEALQGDVQIETRVGEGTLFRIRLPLTLAIIDAMIVRCGRSKYVLPMSHVHESLRAVSQSIHPAAGIGELLSLRKETLPLHRVHDLLGEARPPALAREAALIVIRTGEEPFALLVDEILGQQQVVVKQLGQEHAGLRGFGGSAILGDGKPALIVEILDLIARRAAGRKPENRETKWSEAA